MMMALGLDLRKWSNEVRHHYKGYLPKARYTTIQTGAMFPKHFCTGSRLDYLKLHDLFSLLIAQATRNFKCCDGVLLDRKTALTDPLRAKYDLESLLLTFLLHMGIIKISSH